MFRISLVPLVSMGGWGWGGIKEIKNFGAHYKIEVNVSIMINFYSPKAPKNLNEGSTVHKKLKIVYKVSKFCENRKNPTQIWRTNSILLEKHQPSSRPYYTSGITTQPQPKKRKKCMTPYTNWKWLVLFSPPWSCVLFVNRTRGGSGRMRFEEE